jgi:predicted HTH transcriptional regulator
MLSDTELEALFQDQETDRVERKASMTDGAKIKEAICAFANDYARHGKPGVVFIGQNDDLSCAKLSIDARMLETLGGWRADGNILPFPSMAVRRMTLGGCDVAAIIGGVRVETPTYPAAALKQIIRNTLLHRTYSEANTPVRCTWYSDRVEISSPGGTFGGVTAQNFGQRGVTSYRNPTLAEAMHTLGFAEQFGLGLQIVRASLERNGNPPMEVHIEDHFVHVTVRARP